MIKLVIPASGPDDAVSMHPYAHDAMQQKLRDWRNSTWGSRPGGRARQREIMALTAVPTQCRLVCVVNLLCTMQSRHGAAAQLQFRTRSGWVSWYVYVLSFPGYG